MEKPLRFVASVLSLLFFAFNANAQTYPSTSYAVAGDTLHLTKAQTSSLNFDTTGNAITWNYGTLTGELQTDLIFRAPTQTGFTTIQWPYIANANNTNLSSTDGQTISIAQAGVTLTNYNDYFKIAAIGLKQVASSYNASYNGLSIAVKNQYSQADTIYHFPIAYGNIDSCHSAYTTNIPGIYYEHETLKRNNAVNGAGTVITPYGTFTNALRMTATLVQYDSIAVTGKGLPATTKTYREITWLDAAKKYPVLIVTENKTGNLWVTSSVVYLDNKQYYPTKALFAFTPLVPVQGDTVTFQNLSTNATNYKWNFNDAGSGAKDTSTANNPLHIFNTPGTYLVQLIAYNKFYTDTVTLPVVVNSNVTPTASFTYAQSGNNCTNIVFTNTTTNAQNYEWNFGDTTSLLNNSVNENPTHNFTGYGTFNVRLIALNGMLKDTVVVPVVIATVTPSVTINATQKTICPGTAVAFTAAPVNGGNAPTYQWLLNSHTINGATQLTYATNGLANNDTVKLLITSNNACASTPAATSNGVAITVLPVPVASFTINPPAPVTGDAVNFTSATQNATSYLWSFGDAGSGAADTSTVINAEHIYNTAGVYLVTFIATNNCASVTDTQSITIANIFTGVVTPGKTNALSVYPNPAINSVFVSGYNYTATQIEVDDLLGNTQSLQIITAKQSTINIGYLPGGVYFIAVKNADGSRVVERLVKQ